MKKVLLHIIAAEGVGGTRTVVNDIKNSSLRNNYIFSDLVQEEICGTNVLKAILFVRKYRKIIKASGADVIYVCGLLYSGFLMTLAARLSSIPNIIVSVHGSEMDKDSNNWFKKIVFGYIIEPWTVRMADSVVTVCKKELSNPSIRRGDRGNVRGVIYNVAPKVDISTIPFGEFRKSIGCSQEKIIVAIVGRVVEDKGHRYIIDAINRIENDRYVFVVVGDGPYLNHYYDECDELIRKHRLFLLGVRNDVFQILRDCDIFLFATLHENHSKSLLEAVMLKCAVICTDVGGNTETIDDEMGIIIQPRDSDAIIRALFRMEDEQLRSHYADRAYEIVSNKFSEKNTIGKLDTIFQSYDSTI